MTQLTSITNNVYTAAEDLLELATEYYGYYDEANSVSLPLGVYLKKMREGTLQKSRVTRTLPVDIKRLAEALPPQNNNVLKQVSKAMGLRRFKGAWYNFPLIDKVEDVPDKMKDKFREMGIYDYLVKNNSVMLRVWSTESRQPNYTPSYQLTKVNKDGIVGLIDRRNADGTAIKDVRLIYESLRSDALAAPVKKFYDDCINFINGTKDTPGHIRCNGSLTGQLTRLSTANHVSALARREDFQRSKEVQKLFAEEYGNYFRIAMPVDPDNMSARMDIDFDVMVEKAVEEVAAAIPINKNSDAGPCFPHQKNIDVLAQNMVIAASVFKSVNKGVSIDNLLYCRVANMKPKEEVYTEEQAYGTKTRNYYAPNPFTNFPVSYFYRALMKTSECGYEGQSKHLMGFSPYYGGADRLIKTFLKEENFYRVFSDNLYVRATLIKAGEADRDVWLSIDGKTHESNATISRYQRHMRLLLENVNITEGWKKYLIDFFPYTCIDAGGLCFNVIYKVVGQLSGNLLTALINAWGLLDFKFIHEKHFNQPKITLVANSNWDDIDDDEMNYDVDAMEAPEGWREDYKADIENSRHGRVPKDFAEQFMRKESITVGDTKYYFHKSVVEAAVEAGVILTLESAVLLEELRKPKEDIIYKTDLLGMDVTYIPEVSMFAPLLSYERMVASYSFDKTRMDPNLPIAASLSVGLAKVRSLYLLGGWKYAGLDHVLWSRQLSYIKSLNGYTFDMNDVEEFITQTLDTYVNDDDTLKQIASSFDAAGADGPLTQLSVYRVLLGDDKATLYFKKLAAKGLNITALISREEYVKLLKETPASKALDLDPNAMITLGLNVDRMEKKQSILAKRKFIKKGIESVLPVPLSFNEIKGDEEVTVAVQGIDAINVKPRDSRLDNPHEANKLFGDEIATKVVKVLRSYTIAVPQLVKDSIDDPYRPGVEYKGARVANDEAINIFLRMVSARVPYLSLGILADKIFDPDYRKTSKSKIPMLLLETGIDAEAILDTLHSKFAVLEQWKQEFAKHKIVAGCVMAYPGGRKAMFERLKENVTKGMGSQFANYVVLTLLYLDVKVKDKPQGQLPDFKFLANLNVRELIPK